MVENQCIYIRDSGELSLVQAQGSLSFRDISNETLLFNTISRNYHDNSEHGAIFYKH